MVVRTEIIRDKNVIIKRGFEILTNIPFNNEVNISYLKKSLNYSIP